MPLPLAGAALLPVIKATAPTLMSAMAGTSKQGMFSGIQNAFQSDRAGFGMMGLGALKNLQANRAQKQANAMFPSMEDPELRMLANDFRRRKRAFQTGTAMQAELANQRSLAKQGINAAFRAGGGAAGLNRMQSLLGQAMLGNKQAGMQGEMFYSDKYGDLVNKLAQTRLEKGLLRYNTAQAQAAQKKTDANRMMYGGLARVLGTGNPYDQATDISSTVNTMSQNDNNNYGQPQ